MEVYIDGPLEVVEARDPKGLYKKARAGEIKGAGSVSIGYNSFADKRMDRFHGDIGTI